MNSTLDADPPTTVKGTVGRGRLPNAHYPVREYLTERERERERERAVDEGAAGDNRHGHRDATMILLSYRDGLRAS